MRIDCQCIHYCASSPLCQFSGDMRFAAVTAAGAAAPIQPVPNWKRVPVESVRRYNWKPFESGLSFAEKLAISVLMPFLQPRFQGQHEIGRCSG